MCTAGPCFDWSANADADDVCDMLPLITVNDNSVIAKEVSFEASEFLLPVFEESDFVLYDDHQLVAEINGEMHATSSDGTILTQLNNEAADQNVNSSPNGTVLVCNLCKLQFKCKTHLTRHQLLLHEDEFDVVKKIVLRNRCRQCADKFSSVKQFKIHLSTHHPQRMVCDLCLTTFQNQASLEWHRKYHLSKEGTQNGRYICDVCRKQCASSSHLHLHRKTHLAQKPYVCTYGCDRSFSSSGNRQKHISRMHTHEKKYRCTKCNESFIYARQLQLHRERKHAEFRGTFKGVTICAKCKESFDTEKSFQEHTKILNCLEFRAYECVFCAKRFKQATHLRNHLLTHNQDIRAYGCEFCSKRFTLAGDLKVHRRIHTKEKPFRCHLCPAAFTMGKQLNKHRIKVHEIGTERK
ncbi:zinc finger protein 431-like [Anopheles marshallii]|uniref:zinc finger protein 431-like n=1 Tax=Anopheles marshallii TaxID=1521116 RepID=UPI00237C0BEF|nr:zinc finger protein 431-like [Anopheles marshallii]